MSIDQPAEAQIPELLQLWKSAFGEHGGFWEMFLETAFELSHCRCVTVDGQAAAALYWFDGSCNGQKIAYLYAVVTHPEHRNKGLCRMLLEDVHRHLAGLGYAASLLVPEKEALRQMYRKLGYEDCTGVSEFSCSAGSAPVSVRSIGKAEYGTLRRESLPEASVLQEGKNLDFLAAQVQFFAGADFLLAAYLEEDTLHGMELLGNRDAAPGILRALGCSQGTFRTPGDEKPFAMFHALCKDAVAPNYFGFAFD